jgi:phosphonate transport system substrate-binding protein
MPIRKPSFFLFYLLLVGTFTTLQAAEDYKFGVFPHIPATRLIEFYTPLTNTLSDLLQRRIHLKSSSRFSSFRQKLFDGHYDLALIQPFDYVLAHDQYGYAPLLRFSDPLLMVLVTAQNSPIQTLEDLKGKVIASPPKSAAVHHMTRMALLKKNFDLTHDINFMFTKNHTACYLAVLAGQADVCSTAPRALRISQKEDNKVMKNFRIIHTSEPIPHTVIVAHPRVPKIEQQRIKDYLLHNPLKHFGTLVEAKDNDYDSVRRYWQDSQ